MAYKTMGTLSSKIKRIDISLNFCRMLVRLGVKSCSQDLEDISFFILSLYEAQITEVDLTKLNFINVSFDSNCYNLFQELNVCSN